MSTVDSTETAALKARRLQARVLSPPNVYRMNGPGIPAVEAGYLERIQPPLRHHSLGRVDRPVLLPYKVDGDELTTWFACAPTAEMARALSDELMAFIGASYADFNLAKGQGPGETAQVLSAVAEADWHAIAFRAWQQKFEPKLVEQWQLYWDLLERRPKSAAYVPRTFDQLRAAFDRALAAGDEGTATSVLSSLRERYGLSAENRLFLEIRMAAALGRWGSIASHRLLPTVLELHLPPETYGDVFEALYETQVRPFEEALSLGELLAAFSSSIRAKAVSMFRSRRTSRRRAVLKSFLLFELTETAPQFAACAALLDELGPGAAFGALDSAVRQRVAALSASSNFAAADEALEREQFDRAYELLWPLQDNVSLLRKLLRCARESEDPIKADAVVRRVHGAGSDTVRDVEARSPHLWLKVRSLASTAVAQDRRRPWAEQIRWSRDGPESADAFVERLRELVRSVPPQDLLSEHGFVDAAVGWLTEQAIELPELFDRTSSLWHELFVQRIEPQGSWIPIYQALIETLRARDVLGGAELSLIKDTLLVLVRAGADQETYQRAVSEVQQVFDEMRSPQTMSWILDVCDGLWLAPCRDPECRLRLLTSALQAATDFAARLTPLQRELVRLLAGDAGLAIPAVLNDASALGGIDTHDEHPSRFVAFYSLESEAARRATVLLSNLYPGFKIERSEDLVCTPRLKMLARSADVFVFAWKSSKHAAYDCVKAAIADEHRLVMATGAGTSSLLMAALAQIERQPSA
jgi:hypothetical protein